jgi:GntR family transcriptional regulator
MRPVASVLVIDFRPDSPRWVQVAAVMRKRIESGELAQGSPLPSEFRMSEEYGIARTTVRKVVAALREEGLVYTVPNLGTFVGPPAGGGE